MIAYSVRAVILSCACAASSLVFAAETVVRSVNLPGASMDQEVTYHPTMSEYVRARDDILERLKNGDASAMRNPTDGPWMRVETTAKIGFAYKGVGTSSGRKNYRQITAAEDALYRFQSSK